MATVENISAVETAIRRIAQRKLNQLATGLTKAGLMLQRASMQIVPVDYGPLKASAFTRTEGAGTREVTVSVGYTAAYAVFVHEDLDAAHGAVFNAKYAKELAAARKARKAGTGGTTGPFRHNRGPNQQAKFLEQPFREKRAEIVAIVQAEVAK